MSLTDTSTPLSAESRQQVRVDLAADCSNASTESTGAVAEQPEAAALAWRSLLRS